jgi:hypothetical protein
MLAYDYPLLGAILTMLWFFLWIAWLMMLFRTIGDIFRSDDLGGGGKALWSLFVIVMPFVGVFVYLIARGSSMVKRDLDQIERRDEAFRAYVKDAASGERGSADELSTLAQLRDRGVLTDAEFASQKAKILA